VSDPLLRIYAQYLISLMVPAISFVISLVRTYLLGPGLGGGQRGACNVPSPRGQRTGKIDKMHAAIDSLDGLNASMIKPKKKKPMVPAKTLEDSRHDPIGLRVGLGLITFRSPQVLVGLLVQSSLASIRTALFPQATPAQCAQKGPEPEALAPRRLYEDYSHRNFRRRQIEVVLSSRQQTSWR